MSLSSDSVKRQSFSERICDDLCELILQYLPLKYKHRLECVSKQFQRTIFQKHYEIKICTLGRYKRISLIEEVLLLRNNSFDLKSLETLLKKCPNITSIKWLDSPLSRLEYYDCDNNNEFIALITKYCNNLFEINFTLTQINEKTFDSFHQKFGSKLKVMKRIEDSTEFNRLKTFPNLEELDLLICYDTPLNDTLPGLKLKKLNSLKVTIPSKVESTSFREHLLKNVLVHFKTVRHLYLNFKSDWDNPNNQIFDYISELNDLIHLKVYGVIDQSLTDPKLFFGWFKRLADNCLKLKNIDYCFDVKSEYVSNLTPLLSTFKAFKQLNRLRIQFWDTKFSDQHWGQDVDNVIFSFQAFEGLSNITHLSITFDSLNNQIIDKEVLKEIDIYLPNLKYLVLPLRISKLLKSGRQLF